MTKQWHPGLDPTDGELREIASILSPDGVVILPTDTLYGFHTPAGSLQGVARIRSLKGRESDKPMVILCASTEQIADVGADLTPDVDNVLREIGPAPLTAVVPLRRPLAACGDAPTVAVRIPAIDWLRRLLVMSGPLASTSVNRTGEAPLESVARLAPELRERVDGIVDCGVLKGLPSTIVDFTREPPTVLRNGAFRFTQNLWKTLRKTL